MQNADIRESLENYHMLGIPKPEDLAPLALFLASDDAAFYGAYDNSRIPYVSRPCEISADCFAYFVRCRGIRPAVFSSRAERRQ